MELKPAFTLTVEELAALFNEAFTDYIGGEVHFTAATLVRFLARENVDLDLSQIILRDGQPVGFGYIARRGWSSRLAAMGVVPAATGEGVGSWALARLIKQAEQRGDHQFELEVIEQNTRAVRLYKSGGFEIVRRLVGWEAQSSHGEIASGLASLDICEVARIIVQHGTPDLPWQVSGMTIARHTPPDVAYRLDQAYAVISNPDAAVIALRALIVPPEQRRQGQASRLLGAIFAQHPDKKWVAPAIFPEEYGAELAARFGFTRQTISQFQMRLSLV